MPVVADALHRTNKYLVEGHYHRVQAVETENLQMMGGPVVAPPEEGYPTCDHSDPS